MSDSVIDDEKDIDEGQSDDIKENILIPRRVIFVIDRSGSMNGNKWNKTISSTITAIKQLRKGYDRYCIILFDETLELLPSQYIILAQDGNIKNCIQYLRSAQIGGYTNINKALLTAITMIKEDIKKVNNIKNTNCPYAASVIYKYVAEDKNQLSISPGEIVVILDDYSQDLNGWILAEKNGIEGYVGAEYVKPINNNNNNINDFYMNQIILISDGEPNYGVINTNKIIRNVKKTNNLKDIDKYNNKISIFSFGVGNDGNDSEWIQDLNHSFLKILAVNNNGFYKRIKQCTADIAFNEYFNILSKPILSNIMVKYNNENIKHLTETKFSTLYCGNDLIICGKIEGFGLKIIDYDLDVIISAITAKEIKENDKIITKPVNISKKLQININGDADNNNCERIWAYFKLQQYAKQELIENDYDYSCFEQ